MVKCMFWALCVAAANARANGESIALGILTPSPTCDVGETPNAFESSRFMMIGFPILLAFIGALCGCSCKKKVMSLMKRSSVPEMAEQEIERNFEGVDP